MNPGNKAGWPIPTCNSFSRWIIQNFPIQVKRARGFHLPRKPETCSASIRLWVTCGLIPPPASPFYRAKMGEKITSPKIAVFLRGLGGGELTPLLGRLRGPRALVSHKNKPVQPGKRTHPACRRPSVAYGGHFTSITYILPSDWGMMDTVKTLGSFTNINNMELVVLCPLASKFHPSFPNSFP